MSLEELLYSIHLMGAGILATPELELSKEESKKLSNAIQEVGKHYAVMFDPKKVAIWNLFATAGFIYGPRIVSWRARRRESQVKLPPSTPAPIPIGNEMSPGVIPPGGAPPLPPRPKEKIVPNPADLWPEPAADFPGIG